MIGKKITREIFASLPAIDGRMEDLTQEQRNAYVKQVYKNTEHVLKTGVIIPVKESHEKRNDDQLHGRIDAVRFAWKQDPTPHYVIEGDIILDEDYFEMYKEGRFPGASVEIADGANLMAFSGNPDDRVGQYIFSVALLGSTAAAMPQLRTEKPDEQQPYQLFSRLVGEQVYQYKEYEGNPMGNMKEKFMNAFMQVFAESMESVMEQFFPVTDDGKKPEEPGMTPKPMIEDEEKKSGPPPAKQAPAYKQEHRKFFGKKKSYYEKEEEMATDNKDEIIAKLQAQTEAQQKIIESLQTDSIETAYQHLASTGKVTPELKGHFESIAKTQGLKFAREVFKMEAVTPPTKQDIVTPPAVVAPVNEEEKKSQIKKQYAQMGLDEKQQEEAVKRHFEREKADALAKQNKQVY